MLRVPYFHYTSRVAAQSIMCNQPARILPGKGGKIWLTKRKYRYGYTAADQLAITKLIEVVCEIPDSDVQEPSQPRRITKARKPDGSFARHGGGWEVTTLRPINVRSNHWSELKVP